MKVHSARQVRILMCMFLIGILSIQLAQAQVESHSVQVDKYARMRVEPTVNSPTLQQFFDFTEVEAVGFDGLYWLIRHKDQIGYIINSGIEANDEVRGMLRSRPMPSIAQVQAADIPSVAPPVEPEVEAIDEEELVTEVAVPEPEEVLETGPLVDEVDEPVEVEPASTPSPEAGPEVTEQETAEPEEMVSTDVGNEAVEPVSTSHTDLVLPVEVYEQQSSGRGLILRGGGGLSIPLAPPKLNNYWNQGVSFGGGIGFAFNHRLELGLEYGRSELAINQDSILIKKELDGTGFELDGGEVSINNFMAFLKFNVWPVDRSISPYIMLGGGMFQFSPNAVRIVGEEEPLLNEEDEDIFFEESENVGGALVAAGLDVRIGAPIYLFIEGRGVFGLTRREGTFLSPLRIGLTLR